jgi:CRP/FNR family transcriptional regulator, cyclic AMP receptor protein
MKIKNEPEANAPHPTEMPALRPAIAGHPFFRHLNESQLDILADCAMQIKFRSGDVIFQQGDVANRFYLIERGSVALQADQPGHGTIPIQTLGAGDILGWSWLFPPHIWRFSARAVEPTEAIFFYGTWLRARCEQDPGLGDELMRRMARVVVERLQATQMQLVEISQVALRAQLQALELAAPAPPTEPARNIDDFRQTS